MVNMKSEKKSVVQTFANQWSFLLTLLAFIVFIFFMIFGSAFSSQTWIYSLIPFLLVSLILGVIGIPFENPNKRRIAQSIFSILLSLSLILLLGVIYLAPILFPFGIPSIWYPGWLMIPFETYLLINNKKHSPFFKSLYYYFSIKIYLSYIF